jgi:hypothetical protein
MELCSGPPQAFTGIDGGESPGLSIALRSCPEGLRMRPPAPEKVWKNKRGLEKGRGIERSVIIPL